MKLSPRYRNYINREPQYLLSTLVYNSCKHCHLKCGHIGSLNFFETLQYFFQCVLDILKSVCFALGLRAFHGEAQRGARPKSPQEPPRAPKSPQESPRVVVFLQTDMILEMGF